MALAFRAALLDYWRERRTQMKTLIADKFSEAHIARLNQLGCEVTYQPTAKAEELAGIIAPYKILVVRGKQVTADTLKAANELALVLRAGAGVNTIDVKTASARGVFVSNCPGKNSIAVAELVFALPVSYTHLTLPTTPYV